MGEGDRLKQPAPDGVTVVRPPRQRRNALAVGLVVALIAIGLPFLLVFALRFFSSRSLIIPGGSMEPTLPKGSLVLAESWPYLFGDPQRNDIAQFRYPLDTKTDYMKRVIGLPGETIEIRDGEILIDEQVMDSSFKLEAPIQDYGPIEIPDANYFVIGDNMNHSSDSRVWGFVPRDLFIRRFWFRYK